MNSALLSLITGVVMAFYGLYLLIFKDIVTNKEIILMLIIGFAYIGYSIGMIIELMRLK